MRSILLETLTIVVVAIVIVCGALALLPGEGTWLARASSLLTSAATLSFGYSTIAREPVLLATARATLLSGTLVVVTTILLLLVAVPVGVLSATRPRDPWVVTTRRVADLLSGVPVLVWSSIIFIVAARGAGVILLGDSRVVPALLGATLTLFLGDRLLTDLLQRVSVRAREVLAEPYMRTVSASGFGMYRHLLQSIVPAVAEAVSARAVFLVSGAIVAERVFNLNGLGFLVVQALVIEPEPRLVLALSISLISMAMLLRVSSRMAALAADPRLRLARPA